MTKFRIGKPEKSSLPARILMALGLCVFLLWRKLRLPRGLFTRQPRSLMEHWSDPMFLVPIRSLITRAYIDQTCTLERPADLSPRVETEEPYRLSEKEIGFFYDNGYLPPFDVHSEEEIRAFGEKILEARERESTIYGMRTDRDRHLEMPRMLALMRHPAVVERCAQLLGPDLLCWRSQFFYKGPGGEAVQWHQASSYLVEDMIEPALLPPDRDRLFQLTIWVAVDAATRDNGCLRVIPGTHTSIRTVRFGTKDTREGFYHTRYELEYPFREGEEVYLEARPGQAILFSERVIHGSGPNVTDRSRSAFNYRVIRPDTKVYRDKTFHRATHMQEVYFLDKWGCVLLRGEDRFGLNPVVG